MYARTSFEQSPRISSPTDPSPHKSFSSLLFSHRCAHSCLHPLCFDIHPQNTRGWVPSFQFQFLVRYRSPVSKSPRFCTYKKVREGGGPTSLSTIPSRNGIN